MALKSPPQLEDLALDNVTSVQLNTGRTELQCPRPRTWEALTPGDLQACDGFANSTTASLRKTICLCTQALRGWRGTTVGTMNC